MLIGGKQLYTSMREKIDAIIKLKASKSVEECRSSHGSQISVILSHRSKKAYQYMKYIKNKF